jgi:riboflavin synthase
MPAAEFLNPLPSREKLASRDHPPQPCACMFTGIIEEAGVIEKIAPAKKSIEMTVRANTCGRGLKLGDSVSVNGCCLTAVKISARGKSKSIQFDLLQDSWDRTNFQFAKPGSRVNLERSLRANGELGGHFVTGHVDGLGKIIRWERSGKDHLLEIAAPADVMRYVIFKGSIAVDGMSLTVGDEKKNSFRIWIIPHTFEITALRERKVGDAVNLEADLLGKYVERFLSLRRRS